MTRRPPRAASSRIAHALLVSAASFSGCEVGDPTDDEALEEAASALAECREGSFGVDVATTTLLDVQQFDPPLRARIPATMAGADSQPAWTVELRFMPGDPLQAVTCTYACAEEAGACVDDRLAAVGCTGSPAAEPGDVIEAETVTMRLVPAGLPAPLVPSAAAWDFSEAGPCPSACDAAALPLGDGDPCTLDFCRDVGGEAAVVHVDACSAPVDPTVTSKMADILAVVLDEDIQVDVAEGAINVVIAAGVGGRVLLPSLDPAPGVGVSVVGHPDFGRTETDAEGEFRMLVNGGGELTLAFDHANHVQMQRQILTSWQTWLRTDDVVLTDVSQASTFVRLEDVVGVAAAVGETSLDDAGARTPRILIPEGTTASLEMADGSIVPTSTATVRITELTVGEEGLLAIPTLPPETAYTHAFEASLDEAREAGATGVLFDSPVYYYVENFIGVAPGSAVRSGATIEHARSGSASPMALSSRSSPLRAGSQRSTSMATVSPTPPGCSRRGGSPMPSASTWRAPTPPVRSSGACP